MAEHEVTIEADGGLYATLKCNAPADALCHARWTCECETLSAVEVLDGVPRHAYVDEGSGIVDAWHEGTFDLGHCELRVWFDECGDVESMYGGSVTVPVTAEWDGDGYTFSIVTDGVS